VVAIQGGGKHIIRLKEEKKTYRGRKLFAKKVSTIGTEYDTDVLEKKIKAVKA